MSDRWIPPLAGLLIAAFVVLAYLPSFAVPFVFDDFPNIVLNQRVQPEGLAELANALDARGARDRPVAMLTFALDYLVAGLDTRWYHAVNLAIHLVNTLLLGLLAWLLARAPASPEGLQRNALAFACTAALLWAVHPVNTQAVTYIVQRMASLAAMFYLLGLLALAAWRSGLLRGRWAAAVFGAALAAGLGTKAHVVTLPFAAVLLDVAFFSRFRRVHGAVLALGAGAGIALLLLLAGPQLAFLLEASPQRGFSGLERLMTQARVVLHYLTLLAWPDADRLQLDYDFSVSRGLLSPPATLAAAAVLAALTAAAIAGFRRATWPAFGWLFFLLALSVESSFILLELAFEHRLYLPATLLIAGLLAPVFAHCDRSVGARPVSIAVIALAGLLAWQTMIRNQQWQDLGSFWAGDLERGASLYRSGINAGLAYLRAGDFEQALVMLDRLERSGALETPIQRAKVKQLMGEAHFRAGEFEQALADFEQAVGHMPGWSRSVYFAGMALARLGELDRARGILEQMRAHRPDSVLTASLEAELMRAAGEPDAAVGHLRQRLAAAPRLRAVDRSFALLQIGNIRVEQGEHAAAAEAYRAAVAADPDNRAARASLEALQARTAAGD